MEEELIFKFLGNVGVPATLCFYVLWGVNRTLGKLTEAINKLATEADKHKIDQIAELEKLKDEIQELKFKINHLEANLNESIH